MFEDQQEIPSRQQKSAKKGSKRYLMFGPNHILLILRWDDGRSPGHKNVCRWFLNRISCVFLGKYSKWKFKFSKLVKIICVKLFPSQQNGWLLRVQDTLCVTDKVNRNLSNKTKNSEKKKKNEKRKSKSVKSLGYMDEFFSRLTTSHYLKVASDV